MASALRMLQQNMGGSRKVTLELRVLAMDEDVDVVVMHEPFNPDGEIEGLHPSVRVVSGANECRNALTAITIFNEDLEVYKLEELCSDSCACVQFDTDIGEVFLVSMYCPLECDIDFFLEDFQELLKLLENKQVIISIDANAKSIWWSNTEETDDRGEKLEDIIIMNSLCVVNRKDPLGLMSGKTGFTDLTLTTYNIIDKVVEWQVTDDWASCGKRTIGIQFMFQESVKHGIFEVNCESEENNFEGFDQVFVPENKEDLSVINNNLNEGDLSVVNNNLNEDDLSVKNNNLNKDDISETSKSKPQRRNLPWWNDNLEDLRQKVCKAKRKMKKETERSARINFKINFLKLKRLYTRAIRKARVEYTDLQGREKNEFKHPWIREKEASEFNFEADNEVISLDGSTSNWNQSTLAFSDESAEEDGIQNDDCLSA